jgi:hypothetical protein
LEAVLVALITQSLSTFANFFAALEVNLAMFRQAIYMTSWRFTSKDVIRSYPTRKLERDIDAAPELAVLFVDVL